MTPESNPTLGEQNGSRKLVQTHVGCDCGWRLISERGNPIITLEDARGEVVLRLEVHTDDREPWLPGALGRAVAHTGLRNTTRQEGRP